MADKNTASDSIDDTMKLNFMNHDHIYDLIMKANRFGLEGKEVLEVIEPASAADNYTFITKLRDVQ